MDTGPRFERDFEAGWVTARRGYADAQARWAAMDTAGMSPADLHRELVRIFMPIWHFYEYGRVAQRVDSIIESSVFSPEPFKYWSAHERDGYDLRARLSEIRVPTLIIIGDDDYPPLIEGSRLAQERIPGARLEVVPRSGHWPMIERPDVFFPAVRRFLGEGSGERKGGCGVHRPGDVSYPRQRGIDALEPENLLDRQLAA